jgi:taurine dioxygenase
MDFDLKPLDGEIGVEVVGLDLASPIPDTTRRDLYDTWLDAGILVFRGIGTSAEGHLALSECFGELEVHPVESIRLRDHPTIIRLSSIGENEPIVHHLDGEPVAGLIPWHTDLIYMTTPNRGALLRMVEKPDVGGQTGWIDTAAAYDALPEATQQQIAKLEARFDFVADICHMRFGRPENMRHGTMGTSDFPEFSPVAHPLVWTHPESGRKSLNISPVQLVDVVDMDREEGDALLEELVAHTTDGRFTYVHDWELDDIVLWDNWRTMHKAFGTPPQCGREVQRTTIKGERTTGRLL